MIKYTKFFSRKQVKTESETNLFFRVKVILRLTTTIEVWYNSGALRVSPSGRS